MSLAARTDASASVSPSSAQVTPSHCTRPAHQSTHFAAQSTRGSSLLAMAGVTETPRSFTRTWPR